MKRTENWMPKVSCWHKYFISTRAALEIIKWGVNTLFLWHDFKLNVSFWKRYYNHSFRTVWVARTRGEIQERWKTDLKEQRRVKWTERDVRWLQRCYNLNCFSTCFLNGTWEATNKPPEFSFLTYLVRETLLILLLSPVKWFCPLSLVIFPTASHTLAHFHAQTINFLLRCWFCFSKAAHSSALLSCRRAAVASQPCCVGQRGCEALSHTQTHTGNIAVHYTQSSATGGEEITWL